MQKAMSEFIWVKQNGDAENKRNTINRRVQLNTNHEFNILARNAIYAKG